MQNSAQIALLFRISELVRKYGLRPSEAEAELSFEMNSGGKGFEILEFSDVPTDPEKEKTFWKIVNALGCDETGTLKTRNLGEMEDIVERAISLAPRAAQFRS